jgi:hypothetical protein
MAHMGLHFLQAEAYVGSALKKLGDRQRGPRAVENNVDDSRLRRLGTAEPVTLFFSGDRLRYDASAR